MPIWQTDPWRVPFFADVACPEEVAYRMGYITVDDLRKLGEALGKSGYGQYITALANDPADHGGGRA